METEGIVPCHPRLAPRWAGLVCAIFLLWTGSGVAQVRFDTFVGFDGAVREGAWFPLVCEVQNDGPPFTAIVEVGPGNYSQGQVRMMEVELPTGTLKRFSVPVYCGSRSTLFLDARIRDEKGKVRAEQLSLRPRFQNDWDTPLFGAMVRLRNGVVPEFPPLKARGVNLRVSRLQPALLPDNPLILDALDTIYLNSETALELKVPQVEALLGWLRDGGHLVVGAEQVGDVNGNAWLRDLLPCQLSGTTTVIDHTQLQDWLRAPLPQTAGNPNPNPYERLDSDTEFEQAALPVAKATLRDGEVFIGSSSLPLAVTARRGHGRITVLTFSPELEPFRSWLNRSWFWARLADIPPQWLAQGTYNRRGWLSTDGIFGSMIDSTQVRKLPVGWLLLLLLSYLLVIGPIDQYWLKKMGKQMWTWVTFPIYVALFSGLIYLIGYKLRAGESEWNELNVVDVFPRAEQAVLRGRTYASVYSPVNARYPVASEQPTAVFRGETAAGYGPGQENSQAIVRQRGNSFTGEISVPVWTSQLYVSDWIGQQTLPLQFRIQDKGNEWMVTVDNQTGQPAQTVRLVVGERIFDLGSVAAGEQKPVAVQKNAGTPLTDFVQAHGSGFAGAVGYRQRAFGNSDQPKIGDMPASAMATCFLSFLGPRQQTEYYGSFRIDPQLDQRSLIEGGQAVLLAWVDDYSPVRPLNRFTPRRKHEDTLFRLAVPLHPLSPETPAL